MTRNKGRMTFDCTGTINMGLNYPCNVIECFPGDSFRLEMKALLRFLPQVAPTMSNVVATVDTYTVPLRQLCEKIGLNWDDYLTGGEDGTQMLETPMITIPETGYEPGSLADWLNYPTNYANVDFDSSKPESDENPKKFIVAAGRKYSAFPVIAYMHIINENYRDQNFIKKLDLTKYQEFLDGTYKFETPTGDPIDYGLCVNGIFPKAWSRDYFGRALPNTQRGPLVSLPIGGEAPLQPSIVAVNTDGGSFVKVNQKLYVFATNLMAGTYGVYSDDSPEYGVFQGAIESGSTYKSLQSFTLVGGSAIIPYRFNVSGSNVVLQVNDSNNFKNIEEQTVVPTSTTVNTLPASYVDLSDTNANLSQAAAASVIAFRLAARMQRFGEILQTAGARAVEYTLAMFGVRIPDGRVQRPIFHGSFRMPVVFSEVLQTSNTTETSPQGNLAGHGITGGVNSPIHIKVIEHSFVISILNVMPRSQYREFVPAYMFRKNRLDIPVPMMQGIGDQPVKREQIFPNSKNPDEAFGFIPQYSDLWYIPSGLHGHMKDTFLHWNMARAYKTEPVLSAAWRYERPTDRSFSVRDEDQMQIQIGFVLKARRPFARNVQPGIHIV